jgi:hypothetical protein
MRKFDVAISVLKAKLWDLAHFPQSWNTEEKIMAVDIEEAISILEQKQEQKNEDIR